MKTLILATPRSGSHAYASLWPNNYSEVMNIEDLLLPRLKMNDAIDYKICSQHFLSSLENHDWDTAYNHKPKLQNKHYVIEFTEELEKQRTCIQPSKETFLKEHIRRWKAIKNKNHWTIKLIEYQGVPNTIIWDMILKADKVVALKRKDLKAQALSLCVTNMTQNWHNSAESITLDYDLFVRSLESIMQNNKWVDKFNVETIYYEDLNLSNSKIHKNNNKIDYDKQILNKIYDQTINRKHQL
jgi:hypothetical protein